MNVLPFRTISGLLIGMLLLGGCKQKVSPTDEATTQPLRPVAERGKVSEACAWPLKAAPSSELKLGRGTALLSGHQLVFPEKSPKGMLALGVLGSIGRSSPENLSAIAGYLAFFSAEHADAIVLTGDIGENAMDISRILSEVAKSGLPVFALIGNRECESDFTQGVATAQKQFPSIFNLNVIRAVAFPEATLVSLPGYYDAHALLCATGCQYDLGTLNEVRKLAKEAKSPVVLLSHGSARGTSDQSLDYALTGIHTGDTRINALLKEAGISFGLHSNIKEAGARATDSTGTRQIQQEVFSRELFLNPGPAETTRVKMNDGTSAQGYAAVFRIRGAQASWKLFRARPPKPPDALPPPPEIPPGASVISD